MIMSPADIAMLTATAIDRALLPVASHTFGHRLERCDTAAAVDGAFVPVTSHAFGHHLEHCGRRDCTASCVVRCL